MDNPGSLVAVDSIAGHSTSELANYLSEMQKKTFPDMSAIELEATAVPGQFICTFDTFVLRNFQSLQ